MDEKKNLPPSDDSDFWGKSQKVTMDVRPELITNPKWIRVGNYAILQGRSYESAVCLDWHRYDIRDGEIVKRA